MDGISIIVCTYNGKERLAPTLESIFRQQVVEDFNWELLIIDNASTDKTGEFCKKYIKNCNPKVDVRVIDENNPGLNNARKTGLLASRYNWALFCDDDNHLFSDYLQKAWSVIQKNKGIGVIGGEGIPLFVSTKPEWFDFFSHSYAIGPQSQKTGVLKKGETIYGAGMLVYKPILLTLFKYGFKSIMSDRKGGLLSSGGDVEWCYLFQLMGFRLIYSSDLRFYHVMSPERLTWNYYLNLKKGITSGSAKLSAYQYLLRTPNTSSCQFTIFYLARLTHSISVWLFYKAKLFFAPSRYNKINTDLANIILKAKSMSYIQNFRSSQTQFQLLKRITKAINLDE